MTSSREFLRDYTRALLARNAALFAGAGLSQPAGFVNWKELLREVASEVGLDVDQEHDLISVAQYHVNEKGGRGKLNQLLLDQFISASKQTENHEILARLPIDTYWTTNYDTLLERALEHAGKNVDIKVSQESLATTRSNRDAILYKMHGDVSRAEEAVLTKDDYEGYNNRRQLFTTKLQGDLVSKTFLFIGFSFDDPNLEYILSRIRILLGQNQRPHFCIFRRAQRDQFASDAEHHYAQIKQELRIKDLRRFAIHTVLIDRYSEITDLLRAVEARFWRHKVVISGSAAEYGKWSRKEALQFVQDLSANLATDFEIISGFGVDVGGAVVQGVLQHLENIGETRLDTHLVLRPFPQWSDDPSKLRSVWTKYRENLMALGGIALFLFGNKQDGRGVVDSDGMREEFAIAVKRGVKVVPVGATGYVAQELWREVRAAFGRFYGDRPDLKVPFEVLGDVTLDPSRLASGVVDFLRALRDDQRMRTS